MKTIEISGSVRTDVGKKNSKQLRKAGNVPCVIYEKDRNIHFHAHENSFTNLIYTHDAHLVKLNLDGHEYKAVLQDIQFHPVSDKILHMDFIEVFDDKPVVISLPINVIGDSIGVKAGGKLRIKKRNLKVKGLVNDIPEYITIDVTNVKIHHSVKVGDLAVDKIEFLDPKITTILTVATSRVAQKGGEEEAGESAAEAGSSAEVSEDKK